MMAASIIPCASPGEISDALRRVENLVAEAAYEAECIRAGAAEGVTLPWQVQHALELRAEALGLAHTLADVLDAASAAATRRPEHQERAA